MRRSSHIPGKAGNPRRGAAIVESAVVLGVLLTILLGSLDLSLAVFRKNMLTESARRLARAAIIHGEDSASIHAAWGPATYESTADDASDIADVIRDILVAVDPSEVRIRLVWPDGDNATGDRVEAFVSSEYQPILTTLFGADPYLLHATSTMRIEH